jgi:hypothetical protein
MAKTSWPGQGGEGGPNPGFSPGKQSARKQLVSVDLRIRQYNENTAADKVAVWLSHRFFHPKYSPH